MGAFGQRAVTGAVLLVASIVPVAAHAQQAVRVANALASTVPAPEHAPAPPTATTDTATPTAPSAPPTMTASAPDPQAELPAFETTLDALRTQPVVERLLATEGTPLHAAYAAVIVHRPLERVLATIHDVNHYREFVPRFVQSQELRHSPTSQDVFIRLAINSVIQVWARVRYRDSVLPSGAVVVAGHAVQGNVDRLDVRLRATPIDGGASTVLELWSLVVPALPIPIPGSILDREQSTVARQGVLALSQRASAELPVTLNP